MTTYLTIHDVAEEMDVEYKTVYRLVTSGKLPSFRVGRVYRIRRVDLDRYIEEQIYGKGARAASAGKLICGLCGANIPSLELAGGFCQHPNCDDPLCATCWGQEQRHCRLHQPTSDERLAKAKADMKAGKVDRIITAIEARQREKNFIARFEKRITDIGVLQHPITNETLRIDDWSTFYETSDESNLLLQAMSVAFLDRSVLAVTPVNESARFIIKHGDLGRNRPRQGLIIGAMAISDIQSYAADKAITQPASRKELMLRLDMCEREAIEHDAFYVVALAATAGWDEKSIRLINTNTSGRSYQHRLLAPLLVDLETNRIYYNEADERLHGFRHLLRLADEAEELLRIRKWIEKMLTTEFRTSVAKQEVVDALGVTPEQVLQVFNDLSKQSRYRQTTHKTAGPVIYVNE